MVRCGDAMCDRQRGIDKTTLAINVCARCVRCYIVALGPRTRSALGAQRAGGVEDVWGVRVRYPCVAVSVFPCRVSESQAYQGEEGAWASRCMQVDAVPLCCDLVELVVQRRELIVIIFIKPGTIIAGERAAGF